MQRSVFGLVLAMAIAVPAIAAGQWVRHPTADAPRKADGSPDLTAPTPRLPDGKPDFSGIWRPFNPVGWDYAVHFAAWTIAYLPGFAALMVGAPAKAGRHVVASSG